MGSKNLKVDLRKLKIFISAYQLSILHKAFTVSHFRFSSTKQKRTHLSLIRIGCFCSCLNADRDQAEVFSGHFSMRAFSCPLLSKIALRTTGVSPWVKAPSRRLGIVIKGYNDMICFHYGNTTEWTWFISS